MKIHVSSVVTVSLLVGSAAAFSHKPTPSRRDILTSTLAGFAFAAQASPANAAAAAVQDSLNIESFLRTGVDVGGNMVCNSQ